MSFWDIFKKDPPRIQGKYDYDSPFLNKQKPKDKVKNYPEKPKRGQR